jgi:hypothetical protein
MTWSLKKHFGERRARASEEQLSETEQALRDWGIKYKKLPDGSLKVRDLDISNRGLSHLPGLTQVTVTGTFNCSWNALTSLEGMPVSVKHVECQHNRLTSLAGAPREVKFFDCSHNRLTSLKGGPEKTDSFHCDDNQLASLEGGPVTVNGYYWCENNPLQSLYGAPARFDALTWDYDMYRTPASIPAFLLKRPEGAADTATEKPPAPATLKARGLIL